MPINFGERNNVKMTADIVARPYNIYSNYNLAQRCARKRPSHWSSLMATRFQYTYLMTQRRYVREVAHCRLSDWQYARSVYIADGVDADECTLNRVTLLSDQVSLSVWPVFQILRLAAWKWLGLWSVAAGQSRRGIDGWTAISDTGVIFQDLITIVLVACKLSETDHIVVTANNRYRLFVYSLFWSMCIHCSVKYLANENFRDFLRWRANYGVSKGNSRWPYTNIFGILSNLQLW